MTTSITDSVTEEQIQARIERHDEPSRLKSVTVKEVQDTLSVVEEELRGTVIEYHAKHEIVYEDTETVIYADARGEVLPDILETVNVTSPPLRNIIIGLMQDLAEEIFEYDRDAYHPLVIRKSAEWQVAEQHVTLEIADLVRRSGGAARGLDRWALERREQSSRSWGNVTDRNHTAVARNARRGREHNSS